MKGMVNERELKLNRVRRRRRRGPHQARGESPSLEPQRRAPQFMSAQLRTGGSFVGEILSCGGHSGGRHPAHAPLSLSLSLVFRTQPLAAACPLRPRRGRGRCCAAPRHHAGARRRRPFRCALAQTWAPPDAAAADDDVRAAAAGHGGGAVRPAGGGAPRPEGGPATPPAATPRRCPWWDSPAACRCRRRPAAGSPGARTSQAPPDRQGTSTSCPQRGSTRRPHPPSQERTHRAP